MHDQKNIKLCYTVLFDKWFPEVSKDHTAFIFRNRESKKGAAVGPFSNFTKLRSKRRERESRMCKEIRLLRACDFFGLWINECGKSRSTTTCCVCVVT